jgi:succinate-semialdehyde dehydrogenase/glutarate-semialdehyde dehydrogenase
MATDVQIARQIASVNPATGDVLRTFGSAGDAEVRAAIARARSAQKSWADVGVQRRLKLIANFQRLLHKRKAEVARVISSEAGKPYVEALTTEVVVVLDAARFLIDHAYTLLRDRTVPHGSIAMKTKAGRIVREPYGVIGIISPWNYPFSTPSTEVLAALAAGNTVVLKPSEFTSLCALELEALLHEAGIPKDVFSVIVGDGGTGAALVNSGVDKLIFTGSVATGKRVAHTAADRLLPIVLELGGKDPMIVLEDVSLEVVSSGAVWGAFVNCGQACLSVERCYVHRSIYEKFVTACAEKTRKLRVGNGLEPETDIGPLIHSRQLNIVESHVDDAIARGARILCGGKRLPELGPNFYAPTVLADVTHDMRIMREETFGPVLPVMAFDSEEEAIRLANDSEFGLAASVWTPNRARGENIARRLNAGTVMVNDVVSCFGISEAPHGGVKASGLGRTHGSFGLEEMVWVKYLDSDRLPNVKKVWWYGYGEAFSRQMEGFLDMMFARNLGTRLKGAIKSAGSYVRKGRL